MKIEIERKVTEEVTLISIDLHIKVCDRFYADFKTDDGGTILEYEGYVPGFFPGLHYGDYLILKIDPATGTILNWNNNPDSVARFVQENLSDD